MPTLAETKYFDPKLFAKIGNLEMIARSVVEGTIAGRHKSPFHGFSVEFAEYREYSPGDDLKHVDWKVMAKTDKLYVKRFEAETNLRSYILIDVSGSMAFGSDEKMTKLDYAGYCAAAMSYLMIRQQDAVGLVAFDRTIRHFLAPRNSTTHLLDILTVLDRMEAREVTQISEAFHVLAERIRRRGLILVFSDFLDDPERVIGGLAHFRHKKHEIILFHVIDPAEQDFPYQDFVEFEDLETQQRLPVQTRLVARNYREKFNAFIQDLQRRCAEHAIEYVPLRTDRPVETALLQYIGKRMRLG